MLEKDFLEEKSKYLVAKTINKKIIIMHIYIYIYIKTEY